MLEEKNDNLQYEADGIEVNIENPKGEKFVETKKHIEIINSTTSTPLLDAEQHAFLTTVEEEQSLLSDDTENTMQKFDYEIMSSEELLVEFERLIVKEDIGYIKDHVEEIRRVFLLKSNVVVNEGINEENITSENGSVDSEYGTSLKKKWDVLYEQYKDKRNQHIKNLQVDLKRNLENRLAIIEEIKGLINTEDTIKDLQKKFLDLKEQWNNAGAIPKDKYNHVWNNYHFHVENYYDYLHLDREARDLDFKHNLELKNKIISRVEELLNEEDLNKAFRELQTLHRIWKEEIGPVSKEHRKELWEKFSALTKQMHDKKENHIQKLKEAETHNLEKKRAIIAQLEVLAKEEVHSHVSWLKQIDQVELLRKSFYEIGKVPLEYSDEVWRTFKQYIKDFNILKNAFYKRIKNDQHENLNKKEALVEKARQLKNSDDYDTVTPIMIKIQEEWKKIGHVPKKNSDKLWKEFRDACNFYFDKIHTRRDEEDAEAMKAFESKKNFIDTVLRDFKLSGDYKVDINTIKEYIETWKSFGKVPYQKKNIEAKFNKILDALFDKLNLSKKETEMVKFNSRIEHLVEIEDTRQLENEKIFLTKKIDGVRAEILQLENNIQFITSTKKENPFLVEVRKNIDRHKENLELLEAKLKHIKSL